jgi:hypothetical protein
MFSETSNISESEGQAIINKLRPFSLLCTPRSVSLCLVFLVIFGSACSEFSTPKLEVTPGAPLYAPTPQEFREYVDPNGRFSIRIPNRWTGNEEFVRELNADLNKTLADGGVVDDISELDSSRVEIKFFAGYTLQGAGFDPNIVVMAEDLMTKMSTSQYWSDRLEVIPNQSDPSENYTIGIGRGNGLVVQSAYNESDILKGSPNYIVEDIVLYSTGFTGEVGWYVGCSFSEFTPRGSEDECRHVIHSFRLLK